LGQNLFHRSGVAHVLKHVLPVEPGKIRLFWPPVTVVEIAVKRGYAFGLLRAQILRAKLREKRIGTIAFEIPHHPCVGRKLQEKFTDVACVHY